jgi:hypothetical protein
MRNLRSSRGTSLIQVIIVAGIFGFLSVAMGDLVVSALKAQRGIEARDAVRELEQDLVRHLSESTECLTALKGLSPKGQGQELTELKQTNGKNLLAIGEPLKNGLLNIQQIRFHSFATDRDSLSGITFGTSKLSILVRASGDVAGPQALNRELQISTQLDSSGRLLSCFSIGSSGDRLWLTSANTAQGIYSISPRVGIGAVAKNAMLEVAGGVKVGDDSEPCSSEKLGVLRVQSATKSLEFCDGVNWISAAGSGIAPPQCSGAGAALQYDQGSFICSQQTLVGGRKTEDCIKVGGEVYDTGAGLICKIALSSRAFVWDPVALKNTQTGLTQPCPTGWTSYGEWRETVDRVCTSDNYDGQLNCTPDGGLSCNGSMYGCDSRSIKPDIKAIGRAFSSHSIPRGLLQTYGQTCGPRCGRDRCREITFFCDALVTSVGCI